MDFENFDKNDWEGWGFDTDISDLDELLFSHMRAYIFALKNGNNTNAETEMAFIEWRCHDLGYHYLANEFSTHNYDGAKLIIDDSKLN